jgi:hypothetical protein
MKIKSAKNGYHSTQRTIYGKVPASEFYGFVLGIAFGYIIGALINMSGVMVVNHSDIAIILCIVGVGIGWWYDQKYYMVKDEPEEGAETSAEDSAGGSAAEGSAAKDTAAEDTAQPEIIEGSSTQGTLKKMFERNMEEREQ